MLSYIEKPKFTLISIQNSTCDNNWPIDDKLYWMSQLPVYFSNTSFVKY